MTDYDLVVIGGGPAGATLASFVAMQGHHVLLLEKERFPRHQIGESLLPATVHGICRLLGLTEKLAKAGFQRKSGGTFLWGSSPVPWTFAFSKVTGSPTGYAYQVERSRFDKLLLDNAAELGVQVEEEATVSEIYIENDNSTNVYYREHSGSTRAVNATFIADAGGYQSPFYRLIGERVFSDFFKNVALYGYFNNGKRLPEPDSGNILCAAFQDGWFWYIPLSPNLTSVGAVVSKNAAEKIRQGKEQAFDEYINRCPIIRDHLSRASRITQGEYGPLRVRNDYSYCNTSFYAKRLALVGDAACFVDPVLSSGVHLATYSALLAARSINTCLAGALPENVSFNEFEIRYRREFGMFYRLLSFFYDMHRDQSSYFWEARKILNTTEPADKAFVRVVAGLSEGQDQAFCGCGQTLRTWFDERNSLARSQSVGRGNQMDLGGLDFDSFVPGLNREITQIQLQALLGPQRPAERPFENGGLIPSSDGFHWVRASDHCRP